MTAAGIRFWSSSCSKLVQKRAAARLHLQSGLQASRSPARQRPRSVVGTPFRSSSCSKLVERRVPLILVACRLHLESGKLQASRS